MLGLTTRFLVSVDGVDLGGWARCQGLEVKFNPVRIMEGGNYHHEVVLPGEIKYPPVMLARAMNATDTEKVQAWLRQRAASWIDGHKSGGGGTATITLLHARGGTVAKWMLRNVYPESWKGPDLDAMTLGVATEQLVLAHEGFL
jgi:phage tail-like protein